MNWFLIHVVPVWASILGWEMGKWLMRKLTGGTSTVKEGRNDGR